ncbi:holin A [Curtobacterium phage Ayka]|nr:holin A [Curtobacterium phage Ayka]
MYVAGSKAWKALASRLDVVREQLQNDHGDRPDVKANLREDLDDKHDQNSGKLNTMLRLTVANSEQLATIANTVALIDSRLSIVEDTQTADAMKALKENYHDRSNSE